VKTWIIGAIRSLCMVVILCIVVLGLINSGDDALKSIFICLMGIGGIVFVDDLLRDLFEGDAE
jgi:hypothetical protein